MTSADYGAGGDRSWVVSRGGSGMLVLTDHRVFFIKHHLVGQTFEEFRLREIYGAGFTAGVTFGKIAILRSAYTQATFRMVNKEDGSRIVEEIRVLVAALKQESPSSAAASAAD
jgi:hypothetical protein